MSAHVRDMGVEENAGGLPLPEVAPGKGIVDLRRAIALLQVRAPQCASAWTRLSGIR